MNSSVPDLDDMLSPYDAHLARLADPSPVWQAVQERFGAIKDVEFRSGRGPDGPHQPLKPSTLRRHRTGVPLFSSQQLARSHSDPGHVHYHWSQDAEGWDHQSSHPALPHLRRLGYSVDGLSHESWDDIEGIVTHYLDTGEIRR